MALHSNKMALTLTIAKSAQHAAVAVLATHVVGCSIVSLVGCWRRFNRAHYPSPLEIWQRVIVGFMEGAFAASVFPLSFPWMVTSALPALWAGGVPKW